ncbi:hypothetical protein [Rhodococcus qingshengii]|uniref:hypothetical protein n=1 Tax=Rhodococcus qingshengii TaxID=334542 RepID=UPI0030CED862
MPSSEVLAATQYLLQQPDAYLHRRRYLELITHTTAPDGTTITDYTAAEKYLLANAAATHRKTPRSEIEHPNRKKSRTVDSSKGQSWN